MKIVVLMTVHNRMAKTIKCLDCLYKCIVPAGKSFDVFLTDDGCTDGTADYVSESFDVEIDRLRDWISRRLEWMDAQLIETNGIHELCSDSNNENYYSIDGVKLMRPRSGLVIVRNGINARKIICK